jgi:hypothetical protein
VNIKKVINDGGNTYLKAVVDMKTFQKYFTYRLDEKLFSRLELLNITFKSKIDVVQKQQAKVKREHYYQHMNEGYDAQVRREANEMANQMQRELDSYGNGRIRYRSKRNRGRINLNIGFGW